ncbi:MAG TPA: cytochrome P450 [Sporichthyaceae bacterium]|jgi:cytochrome P450|nr:cytochrome P450 [Sporichthyaceae bacterium]
MATCPYTPDDLTRLFELDGELVRCPFPLYDVLREQAPVTHNTRLGGWVVTRYHDIMEILRDTATFSSAMASGPSSVTGLARKLIDDPATAPRLRAQAERRLRIAESPVLLFTDPPLHKRQRDLVRNAFGARRIKLLEPDVRALTEELLDRLVEAAAHGPVDVVPMFSIPLPMTVIATMLGVPPSHMDTFKRWSNAFTAGVGAVDQTAEQIAEIFEAVDNFYDYFTDQIESRRSEPRDDLLTDLVSARTRDAEPLRVEEILQMLVQFLVAGNETTTNMATTLLARLASDPELAQRVRSNAALVGPLVEEMLRIEAPVQGMFRLSTADATVGGTSIPANSLIWLVYGSGNRDPSTFSEPEHVDLEADRALHLAFAQFEHFCLGANVAKLELRIAVEYLLARFADLRPAGDPAGLPYHRSFILRGISSLPLHLTPAS